MTKSEQYRQQLAALDDWSDVRAVMRENLNKVRLERMGAVWVKAWETKLGKRKG